MSDSALDALLADVRSRSLDESGKGRFFEHLVQRFLRLDPMYSALYESVWLWEEWPQSWGVDCGIDLVARIRDSGEYCAIQCKFYDPATPLHKADIDSFLSESGKSFDTPDGRTGFSSRLIVSTTEKWNRQAERAIESQTVPVSRLGLQDLRDSPLEWSSLALLDSSSGHLRQKKVPRPHQNAAIADVLKHFQDHDRGKLIMACGTGKTFTSLRLTEWHLKDRATEGHGGRILFLAPSISLIAQSLREWTAEAAEPLKALVVCSDSKVGRDSEDMRLHDLAYPATTDADKISQAASQVHPADRLVVFATYQSIEVVADAQKRGLGDFDLVICDEAHRTTGVTLAGESTAHFSKVHDNGFIAAKKRLYMTATPRMYGETSKNKAREKDAVLYSMDDAALYGSECHRLGFGQAVRKNLLCDYKVVIVAVAENRMGALVNRYNQAWRLDEKKAIDIDFATKVIGSWKGLSKQSLVQIDDDGGEEAALPEDTRPMRRAVAFSRSIAASKQMTETFAGLASLYQELDPDAAAHTCTLQHVDGTMNALQRAGKLDWLKGGDDQEGSHHCRVLSNARCLSEGIDVPTLDGVVFFDTRDSMVDIIQSVGRVMRKAPGKQYGYIVLPVCIPAHEISNYDQYIQSDKRFSSIWKIIKALRAHDESLVSETEFRKKIQVITDTSGGEGKEKSEAGDPQGVLDFPFLPVDKISEAVYAAIPTKLGDQDYWSTWAKEAAQIAERMMIRTHDILSNPEPRAEFDRFLAEIRNSLNPAVTEAEVVEMLVQHSITKPIFAALFQDYDFVSKNPVSHSMQRMMDALNAYSLDSEIQAAKFYDDITERVMLATDDKARQELIRNLYDTFFNTAFPRMAERLGIVYTPVCIVDFILHSVQHALLKHFETDINDHTVHILDPFTGTGTFIVRLLQSGLIRPDVLKKKYEWQIHANEIVLLAYYIAAINIESTYHAVSHRYEPFGHMVLTDSFQMHEEYDWADTRETAFLYANNSRIAFQKEMPIRVVLGNPPYSAGQNSANDDNQNLKYPVLDQSISDSYAKHSTATNKNSLYDSYIRAFRLASNRIEDRGIVAFVTNGAFIDGNAADGLRKSLIEEFSYLYIFNLRGNQRTSGEESRREGGKIFGSGSRTTIAISILVKDPKHQGDGILYYHDIGDYLNQQEKFSIIENFADIAHVPWQQITPNPEGDWINQRDPVFDSFLPLGDKKTQSEQTIFSIYCRGVETARDSWVYNFSSSEVEKNIRSMTEMFNKEVNRYQKAFPAPASSNPTPESFVDKDTQKIKWSSSLYPRVRTGKTTDFDSRRIVTCIYRPYCKQALYFDPVMNHRPYLMPKLFPTPHHDNIIISVTGIGANKPFSVLAMQNLADLEAISKGQCFPLYYYEKVSDTAQGNLLESHGDAHGYIRHDAITDWSLSHFRQHYHDNSIEKLDIFHYVYGLLHSDEYRQRFAPNLKKMLPRLPLVENFSAFRDAGRQLMTIHVDYEQAEPYAGITEEAKLIMEDDDYRVAKMRFGKSGGATDRSVIIYNKHLSLSGIPLEAYQYQVNGKSALEWLMERYEDKTDKDSGIRNDPNEYSENPRYIVDLIKRITTISLKTVELVRSLPKLNIPE